MSPRDYKFQFQLSTVVRPFSTWQLRHPDCTGALVSDGVVVVASVQRDLDNARVSSVWSN